MSVKKSARRFCNGYPSSSLPFFFASSFYAELRVLVHYELPKTPLRYTTNYLKHSKTLCFRHFFSGLQCVHLGCGTRHDAGARCGRANVGAGWLVLLDDGPRGNCRAPGRAVRHLAGDWRGGHREAAARRGRSSLRSLLNFGDFVWSNSSVAPPKAMCAQDISAGACKRSIDLQVCGPGSFQQLLKVRKSDLIHKKTI